MTLNPKEKLSSQDREHLLQTSRHLLAEVQALSSRIAAVNEIAMAINRTLDFDDILHIVARQAKWILDFSHCSVCSKEKDGELRFVSLFGPEPSCTWLLLQENDPIATTMKTGRPQVLTSQMAGTVLGMYPSSIVIALESENEIIGTLNFASEREQAYSQEDIRIGYLLALQLAAALRNARRYKELQLLYRALDEEKGKADDMLVVLETLNGNLVEANEHLKKLDAEKNDLLGIVAHDLKNPLAGILLNASTIRQYHQRMDGADLEARLLVIEESADRMSTTIGNLLDLNALESGMLKLYFEQVDLAEISRRVCREYNERAGRKQIVIHADTQDDNAHVYADAHALHEVLENLVSNAVKYSPHGRNIYVRICRIPGSRLKWSIRDEGPGMTGDDQQRLFGKFARLSACPTGGEDSTGLGLSIVKKLVEAMHGTVYCESVYGEGTVFFVELPQAAEAGVR